MKQRAIHLLQSIGQGNRGMKWSTFGWMGKGYKVSFHFSVDCSFLYIFCNRLGRRFCVNNTFQSAEPYRQQPSPLLYSIDILPARNSRLTQRETNHYITRCASELAWPYLAESSPGQLVIDLFAQHQRFAVCCRLSNKWPR